MQLHRNLSDRAAKNNPALSSRLVRESSKGSFVIMIPFLLPFYHCAPLACTLTAVWKEQMTQRSGLRANGDLYLCMTCFVSPGVDRVRTCRWEERLSDTDAKTRSAMEQAKKMFVINSKRWRDRISLFLQTATGRTSDPEFTEEVKPLKIQREIWIVSCIYCMCMYIGRANPNPKCYIHEVSYLRLILNF